MIAADMMLWYKAWTETRWFFRLGLLFLLASALALFAGYPDDYSQRFPNGAIAVSAEQVRALLHDGRTYIWLSWFGTSLLLGLSSLALALASTGIVKVPERNPAPGVSYALSMPVSRRRLAGVRMAAGYPRAGRRRHPALVARVPARSPQRQSFPIREGHDPRAARPVRCERAVRIVRVPFDARWASSARPSWGAPSSSCTACSLS